MKSRVFFLDNLRTFLILMVVVLHAGIVYEPILQNNWIVSDPDKNGMIGLIRMYIDLFVMFTMFFISGYFVPFSMKSKSAGAFVWSKVKRIMLPWLIAVLTLIPAYKVIFLYSRGMPQEAWYTYFHIYTRPGSDWSLFSNHPLQAWLWFLPVLFMFQMIYLGLYRAKLLRFKISLKTGVILTFAVGVVYNFVITHMGLTGWYHSALLHFQNERLLAYLAVFLLGTLCNKLRVFDVNRLDKGWFIYSNVALTVGLGLYTATALNLFFNMIDPARNYYFVSKTVDLLVYQVSAMVSVLSFIHVLVYVFRSQLNFTNRLLGELSRNSYAVYIIHMVVLGAIAYPMTFLAIPAFAKFLLLSVLPFSTSNFLIYMARDIFQLNTLTRVSAAAALCAALLVTGNYASTSRKNQTQPTNEQIAEASVLQKPVMSIHEAVIVGDIELVRKHLLAGTDPNEAEPMGGSSPLITAATFGKTEIAKVLIDAGADVNFQNRDGSTPLQTAAFFCRKDMVQLLLSNGADISIKNHSGSTALGAVSAPFEMVEGIYDYFAKTLGPMGLVINKEEIKRMRPEIAAMLSEDSHSK